jgi:spermidine/putrescine-binding protein
MTEDGLSRRALGTALAMPALRRAKAAGELRIFTWEGYADKLRVGAFDKQTGAVAKVAYTAI